MTVKKITTGTIKISDFVFKEGVEVPVSETLGEYIKDNFSNIFDIKEEKTTKPAPKKTTRKKKTVKGENDE